MHIVKPERTDMALAGADSFFHNNFRHSLIDNSISLDQGGNVVSNP